MLGLGLRVAVISTVMSAAAGLWLGWLLQRREFAGRRQTSVVAWLALAIPAPMICCYLLLGVRADSWVMAAAGTFSALPVFWGAFRGDLASLDPAYARAAGSLGASDWRIFWRIELPLLRGPALSAAALAFARVVVEWAAVTWVAGRFPHD